MKNIKLNLPKIEEDVTTAANINLDLCDDYKAYAIKKKIFKAIFEEEESTLKLIVDGYHYLGGGYPNENSEGRMEQKVREFVLLFRYFSALDMNYVIDELAKYNVTVHDKTPVEEKTISQNDIGYLKREFNYSPCGKSTKDILTELMFAGNDIQTSICGKADKRKDIVKNIKEDTEIDRPEISRLISLKQSKIKSVDVSEKTAAINSSMKVFKELT